jgi:hypothetical protein
MMEEMDDSLLDRRQLHAAERAVLVCLSTDAVARHQGQQMCLQLRLTPEVVAAMRAGGSGFAVQHVCVPLLLRPELTDGTHVILAASEYGRLLLNIKQMQNITEIQQKKTQKELTTKGFRFPNSGGSSEQKEGDQLLDSLSQFQSIIIPLIMLSSYYQI